jgi:hypothetical protein
MYLVKISFLLIDMLLVKFTTKRRFQVFSPLDFSFFVSVSFFPCFIISIPHLRQGIRVYAGMFPDENMKEGRKKET